MDEGGVGRPVAVLAAAGPLEVDSVRRDLDFERGEGARDGLLDLLAGSHCPHEDTW